MALIGSLAALVGACAFALIAAGLGFHILRWLKIGPQSQIERLLLAAALGVIVIEVAFFTVEVSGKIVTGVVATLLIGCGFVPAVSAEWRRSIDAICRAIGEAPISERALATTTLLVVLWQGVTATAPLTGSDALHYHFAVPLQVLHSGFHPDFFLAHSFLIGQGHLLILAGLAVGSEKVALALLWLGGVLAAATAACLVRKWSARSWAWAAALAFLLNPVVFWQSTTAGAPDLWMAFFAAAAVLAIAEAAANPSAGAALLCGFLAGGIAGTKYTGILVAASLFVAFVLETRAWSQVAWFFAAALGAGVWPYLRNLFWTGDPIFPFALRWIAPEKMNAFALEALRADTGASGHRDLLQLTQFPFFAAVDPRHLGFWQFFGPLVLVFAPVFLLWVKRSAPWRPTIITWFLGSVAVGASSGMLRFLLPLFPAALAAAFAGAAELRAREWRVASVLSSASIFSFLLLGAGGFAVYSGPALAAAIGFTSREDYLSQRAPDYALSEFLNQELAGKESEGNALVFLRHLYYLRVPHLLADPKESWPVDPARLTTPEAWRDFLHRNHIRWVVRAPEYPKEFAAPLEQMERDGVLVFVAGKDVSTFTGMRILGVRQTVPAFILRVND